MKELVIGNYLIKYHNIKTETFSVKLADQLYIEDKLLPHYILGETTMSFYEFYQADCPELKESDYQLSEKFKQIIGRFPHTNQEKIFLNDEGSYSIKKVPVSISLKEYLIAEQQPDNYSEFKKKLASIHFLSPIYAGNKESTDVYKSKRLLMDGTYGPRKLFHSEQQPNVQSIQDKLIYVNEMYYFAHYSYAAMIQFLPEYNITSYDQFHEAYGKFVYSFTITKNGVTSPLLWPDYLYHKPENHLEFGLLANTDQKRYQPFNQWKKGEQVEITILAEGFEDVHFVTELKQPMIVAPKLSQTEYLAGEPVCLVADSGLIKEIATKSAKFEWIKAKNSTEDGYTLNYQLTENQLLIPTEQFGKSGRYQLKITSQYYGQLLFLFSIKKEGSIEK